MSGRKTIGFQFYVSLPTQVEAKPTKRSIVNNFDYKGDMISLSRLHGESNADYRDRLFDASVHPAGPLYEGVINGISRDLGLVRAPALTIDLKLSSAGSPVATSPRVDILANRVVLYSDWRPDGTAVVDQTIYTYQPEDTGYYLDDLVAAINTSDYFTASIISGTRSNILSATLVRGNSDRIIRRELIRADKLTQLDYQYITRSSVVFTDKKIFETEVIGSPSSNGEYYINYAEGELESYSLPSGESVCSYHAAAFPMEVDASPVQIFTFQDDDFVEEMFNQRTLDSGEETNSLPNSEGSEIFHQLFEETEVFWGP